MIGEMRKILIFVAVFVLVVALLFLWVFMFVNSIEKDYLPCLSLTFDDGF